MSKKIIIAICSLLMLSNMAFSQAKKPTIMVVPSDNWCIDNQYFTELDNQGTKTKIPNYKAALQGSTELLLVIAKINEMMSERGFPLQNLEEQIKILEKKAAKQSMAGNKTNPISQLKKVAKADIWMQLTWKVTSTGPKKSVTFILTGIDAYSGKQVAGASAPGNPSFSAEVPVLLQEAVLAHIDGFNNQLSTHFADLFENGREVTLDILTAESFVPDLEAEYGGQALSRQIKNWVKNNTVKGRFSQGDADADGMEFIQVRIPLYDKDGTTALDTQTWAEGLQDYLKTLGITASVGMDGLGAAYVTIK